MRVENPRIVLCDGPSCTLANQALKRDLPPAATAEGVKFGIEDFCHGACSKAPNTLIKRGHVTLEMIGNSDTKIEEIIKKAQDFRDNPPNPTPWNI